MNITITFLTDQELSQAVVNLAQIFGAIFTGATVAVTLWLARQRGIPRYAVSLEEGAVVVGSLGEFTPGVPVPDVKPGLLLTITNNGEQALILNGVSVTTFQEGRLLQSSLPARSFNQGKATFPLTLQNGEWLQVEIEATPDSPFGHCQWYSWFYRRPHFVIGARIIGVKRVHLGRKLIKQVREMLAAVERAERERRAIDVPAKPAEDPIAPPMHDAG